MGIKNNEQQHLAEPINTAFFIGVVLCVCFALSGIPSLKKFSIAPVDGRLNPNTASVYELMELPAIGQAKASAIAEYRKKDIFKNTYDLEKVKGIGEKTANKLKPFLKFNE